MHARIALAALALSFVLVVVPSPAAAASKARLEARQDRQLQTLHRDRCALRFFRRHPALARTPVGRQVSRFARAELRWTRRELAATRAALNPWPAHHALWMCIHGDPGYRAGGGSGEAGSWSDADSGGNGHFGGLQMHPGWGYGTSWHASDDSQLVQERAAEDGYAASGYSSRWLVQQWGQTIGPCWRFAH